MPGSRSKTIVSIMFSLVFTAGFAGCAVVSWSEVPGRDMLESLDGRVSRVEGVGGYRSSGLMSVWLGNRQLVHDSPELAAQLAAGARIEASVAPVKGDREVFRIYELWSGGRKLVSYEGELWKSRLSAIACAGTSLLLGTLTVFLVKHLRAFPKPVRPPA